MAIYLTHYLLENSVAQQYMRVGLSLALMNTKQNGRVQKSTYKNQQVCYMLIIKLSSQTEERKPWFSWLPEPVTVRERDPVSLTGSKVTSRQAPMACPWRIIETGLFEVTRHILNVGGSTPQTGVPMDELGIIGIKRKKKALRRGPQWQRAAAFLTLCCLTMGAV